MSKAAKINQLIDLHRSLVDSLLPELLNIHQNFNLFEGASLSETKSNLKLAVSILEKLIAESKLDDLSWNTLHALCSATSSVQSVYTQFKHALDQNSFQSFSAHVDSCLQQIQMYATPALFSSEYNILQINSEAGLLRNELSRLEQQAHSIEKITNTLIESANEKLNSTTETLENSVKEIKEKEISINALLDAVSAKTIASNFEESARQEKNAANWLRRFSISLMICSVAAIGIALWETTTPEYNWINTLIKLGIAISLSIPSAYLARESAKHRLQYYNHLQTSLDLKAIHPFLATLPKEDQHKIKAEIANKIFSPKDNSFVSTNSMPINIQ